MRSFIVCHWRKTNDAANPTSMVPTFANPIWTEMTLLSKPSFTNTWLMPKIFVVRLRVVMVMGFILTTMLRSGDSIIHQRHTRTNCSRCFYHINSLLHLQIHCPFFIQERYIFSRKMVYSTRGDPSSYCLFQLGFDEEKHLLDCTRLSL